MLWLGLVLMWTSVKNMYDLADQVNLLVDALYEDQFQAIKSTFQSTDGAPGIRSDRKRVVNVDLAPFSSRAAVLASISFGRPTLHLHYTADLEQTEPFSSFLTGMRAWEDVEMPPDDGGEFLAWAARVGGGAAASWHLTRGLEPEMIPIEAVRGMLDSPEAYPSELVSHALHIAESGYRPVALAAVSSEQEWAFG
jgi:hypothetical protein